MTSPTAPVEAQKLGGGYKFLGGIALTLGLVMVMVILFSHRGWYTVYRFGQECVRLEQENVRLAAENDRLARTIDRLHHDPVFIQDLIRQELNFVKKNEIIFQFPPENPAHASEPPAAKAGEGSSPAKVNAISARTDEQPQWGCPPPKPSGKKGAGPRRH